MALPLAKFPAEILAQITAALPDYVVLIALRLCGDRLLTSKLKSGGLASLTYTQPRMPKGLVDLVQTHRLLSLCIDSGTCPIAMIKQLIHGLPSCLRRLKVNHFYVADVLKSNELVTFSSLFPLASCEYEPWIISKSFPSLDTLHLTGETLPIGKLGIGFRLRFLCGLPQTLTDLNVKWLDSGLSVDVWRLFPPQLGSLASVNAGFPSRHTPKVLLDTLEELEISPPAFDEDIAMDVDDGLSLEKNIAAVTNPRHIVWPNSLASLVLRFANIFHVDPFPALPTTLTSLIFWQGATPWPHPSFFTRHIPPSVTHLELMVFKDHPNHPSNVDVQLYPLPNIRTFSFTFKARSASNTRVTAIRSYLLRTVPHVENISYIQEASECVMTPEELALLNPHTVRSLHTALHKNCFLPTRSSYALADALPNLTELRLDPPGPSNFVFTFAAIPPKVTSLNLTNCPITSSTLHMLPKSVTHLHAEHLVAISEENWHQIFFPPITSKLATTDPRAPISHYIDLTTFTSSRKHRLSRYEVGYGENRESRVWLEPIPQGHRSVPVDTDMNANASSVVLWWAEIANFPSTLTTLDLPSNLNGKVLANLFKPTRFPHLINLHLGFNIPKNADLGEFSTLQSLQLESIDLKDTSSCPPNLTRLRIRSTLIMPEAFLPLPKTLTEVVCGGPASPYSAFSYLPKLTTFGCYIFESHTILIPELFGHLPSSLTRLELMLKGPNYPLFEFIAKRFTHLKTIDFGTSDLSTELFERLSILFPDDLRVEGGQVRVIDCLDDIAQRTGYKGGSITLDSGDELSEWGYRHLSRAYPFINFTGPRSRILTVSFPGASWSAFAFHLSPTVTELNFVRSFTEMPSDFTKYLPPNLTKLVVGKITPPSYRCTQNLPASLQFLCINADEFNEVTLREIPRGLTHLELNNIQRFPTDYALALPPALTRLRIPVANIPVDTVAALPRSISILEFEKHYLPQESFEALPPQLKIYIGLVVPHIHDLFQEFARQREITWVHLSFRDRDDGRSQFSYVTEHGLMSSPE